MAIPTKNNKHNYSKKIYIARININEMFTLQL